MNQIPWELRRRGLKDSLRHDERIKKAIREKLPDIISEESIITNNGSKTVRIPLKYLDQYRFKYGSPQPGIGQGEGLPGDIIGRQGIDGNGPGGKAGDQPGEHTYEVEISLEELTEMMLKELSLPWMEEKPEKKITSKSHRFTDIRRKGPFANLDKRRTLLNNVRRNAAKGQAEVRNLHEDDLRFKVWDVHEEVHANAAVYMLMDCSGSMTTQKKNIAKSFYFWLVRFLRMRYLQVDPVFIAHDVQAQIVTEQDFFTLSNAGGTCCSSAYNLALTHLQQHHPARSWNTYVFHFSDGDNWPSDNGICKETVEALLKHSVMVGYGEIRYGNDDTFYGWLGKTDTTPSSLQAVFKDIKDSHFLSVTIQNKEEVYKTLQEFLKPRESVNV